LVGKLQTRDEPENEYIDLGFRNGVELEFG